MDTWIQGCMDTGIHVYAEMYGASEQSGPSLRYIASERYGVSARSGALESSGASIEE